PPVGKRSGWLCQQGRDVSREVLELNPVERQLSEQRQTLHVDCLQAPQVERACAVAPTRLPEHVHPGAGQAPFQEQTLACGGAQKGDPKHVGGHSNLRAATSDHLDDEKCSLAAMTGHRFSEMLRNLVAGGAAPRRPELRWPIRRKRESRSATSARTQKPMPSRCSSV